MEFEKYPFEKLQEILKGIQPAPIQPISLTIGEPQFTTPQPIQQAFKDASDLLNRYPASQGEKGLKDAIIDYIIRRYKISLSDSEVVLSFGTREVLFNLPQYLLFDRTNPVIAHPNPFYQIYEGAAKISRARTIYMDLTPENHFTPQLTKQQMEEVDIVILNSPNNPTGKALTQEELAQWVLNALEYNFVIISDECYSEIYTNSPPHSILEASRSVGNHSFKNILAINSISKRSSAPGLRSGYVAGDAEILRGYRRFRTYIGCAVPLPLQRAATVAWSDDSAAITARKVYAQNLSLAQELLGVEIQPFTFYVWLFVKDDVKFTQELYAKHAITTLPGSFLGRDGAGKGFVRIALVYETQQCKEALTRLSYAYQDYMKQ
ncbi:hypothetical protein CCZ01_00180 [Helicobacter monodelphidis]|uniref:succinyldiaminopimelate transaminase n=1 Tax=Helicobacter sp. 15-1451 TaxID=2004995 RepID=UPI000DCDBE06|nr:succinyldiaminopimelate transaminase [Helicobacter sp. 15-1451]RAX59200.1 hypothetical protein CCZ01_00180 [Helicobacter sp. 15-1451]